MEYLTETTLRAKAVRDIMLGEKRAYVKTSSKDANYRVFLSHSHYDKTFAQGIIRLFEELGMKIYVDWNDSGSPRITDRRTALGIKRAISESHLFLVLATKNAKNSKWVPWEVGIADQMKGEKNVGIIPVADENGWYPGNEYLQLYTRIALDGANLWAFDPDSQEKKASLSNFIRNASR